MNDGDRFSIQSACKKRKLKTQATSASVFLPFGKNKKGQPSPKKNCSSVNFGFCLAKTATQKKLAKGTRENARMNSAVVV